MARTRAQAPPAHLTLRAHHPAPARIELVYKPLAHRLARSAAWLCICWGSIPLLLWVPPHYPWTTAAFLSGAYLAYRSWTGRYAVHSFAGICPRCGAALSLGSERTIDLPHTLTCFNCHFEPRLEVHLAENAEPGPPSFLLHQSTDCTGSWEIRWLADEAFLYCGTCHAGAVATPALRRQADAENQAAQILSKLTHEGKPLI
jgi:hypothetical protein